jgi:hypothetical protein
MPAATRRRRAPWVVAAIAVAVAVVAAAVIGWAQLQRPADPAQTATRFWRLLADGKAQEALALTSTAADSVPNGLLLGDAVYGKADRGIAQVEARSFRRTGDEASGTIAYTQHGTRRTARVELALVRRGFLTAPSWQITNAPLARVDVTVASDGQADALSVNGSSLPLPSGDGKLAVPALPGSYTFALGDTSGLFGPVPRTVAVTGATAAVTLGMKPTSKLGEQSVAQATKTVSGCFAQPSLSGCPIADGVRNVFNLTAETSVTYRLTRAPRFSFDATTMRVTSSADGEVVATGSDPNLGQFQNTAQVSFAFDVAVTGGKIALTPHDGGVSNTNKVLSSRD